MLCAWQERPMAEFGIRGWRRYLGPLAPRPRLTASIVIGIVVGVACKVFDTRLGTTTSLILGWDALSLSYLASMLFNWFQHDPVDMRRQAALDDQGREMISFLVIAAAAASVVAVGLELSLAKGVHGLEKTVHIVLAFGTVVVSWLMVQTIFTLHYAHEYYGADEHDSARDAGGIHFPGDEPPDYWDFFYFSIVIGVACATADANFTSKGLRRIGTVHSLVAFAFNTLIVALTINLTAGLF
jgi:uncharacterized membrane protein